MADVTAIVGAGPGLGQALARRFAAEGHRVALVARDEGKLDAMADEIGGGAAGFPADATDVDSLRAALARIADEMGPPAVLIHNASRWIAAKATDLDPATLASELTLGATAALAGAQAVLPGMEAAGRGTILWTGSRMGLHPDRAGTGAPALTAAKCALRGLALAGAGHFHARGIHLATLTIDGTIEPGGPFDPDRIADAFWAAHVAPRDAWTAERVFDGGAAG